jgi:hypothetical protein
MGRIAGEKGIYQQQFARRNGPPGFPVWHIWFTWAGTPN